MRVRVDGTRDDETPTSIDDAVHCARRQDRQRLVGRGGTLRESHGHDRLVLDKDVALQEASALTTMPLEMSVRMQASGRVAAVVSTSWERGP